MSSRVMWPAWAELTERVWRPSLRVVIISGVLLCSAYLAPRMPRQLMALAVLIAGAVFLARKPVLGLLTLLIASFLVSFSISTGTNTSLNATVLLSAGLVLLWGVTLIHAWLLHRPALFITSRPVIALLGLALVAVLAFVSGAQGWLVFARTAPLNTQLGALAVFLLSIGIFLVMAHQIQRPAQLEWLVWTFLSLGALHIVVRLFPAIAGVVPDLFAPGATGSLFWAWLVALSSAQAIFNHRLPPIARLALLGLAVATLAVGWFQGRGWVSGWLPPLVALLAIIWLRSRRLGLLVTAGGLVYLVWQDPGLIGSLFGLKDYSIFTRDVARQILLTDVFPLSPILGLGPANYYWYTSLFPILGYYVQFNSHNNYVDILLQTGLLGFACFAWFVFAIGRLGWQLRHRVAVGFEQAYVYGALAGLCGTLVAAWLGDWFLPFVYNIGFEGLRSSMFGWMFLGGLAGVEHIVVAPLAVNAISRPK